MDQEELFPIRCPAEDDDGYICNACMTKEELEQDGMCSSCADGIWNSLTTGNTFINNRRNG